MMNMCGLFKNTEIKLIEKRNESGDKYVFYFKPEVPMDWKAGQDGILTFKGVKIKGKSFRPFSVASSPDEKIIIIGTRIGESPSEFKAELQSMEIGDSAFFRGPFGSFYIPNYDKNVALIAGGIGITPMRAILKDLEDKKLPNEVTLFYVDSKKDFVFKDDLQSFSHKNPKLKIMFIEDRNNFEENLSNYIIQNKDDSLYFIAGSPKMVNDIRNDIKDKGVNGRNIINHRFRGYK